MNATEKQWTKDTLALLEDVLEMIQEGCTEMLQECDVAPLIERGKALKRRTS